MPEIMTDITSTLFLTKIGLAISCLIVVLQIWILLWMRKIRRGLKALKFLGLVADFNPEASAERLKAVKGKLEQEKSS